MYGAFLFLGAGNGPGLAQRWRSVRHTFFSSRENGLALNENGVMVLLEKEKNFRMVLLLKNKLYGSSPHFLPCFGKVVWL